MILGAFRDVTPCLAGCLISLNIGNINEQRISRPYVIVTIPIARLTLSVRIDIASSTSSRRAICQFLRVYTRYIHT